MNHFRYIDEIIDNANAVLSERFIKFFHLILKSGTSETRCDYKKLPNEVSGRETTLPRRFCRLDELLADYNSKKDKTLRDIVEFHVKFERIHPFHDGNGRVGRLIMLKECLKYGIVLLIIEDDIKMFYHRRLKEWDNEEGYLTDTCLSAQNRFKGCPNKIRHSQVCTQLFA